MSRLALIALATAVATMAALPLGGASTASGTDPPAGIHNPEGFAPATLYFHLNGFSDIPLNTQEPEGSFRGEAQGLGTHTVTCVGQGTGQPLTETSYHTWYSYGSPAYVEYNLTVDGQPRIHPERGHSWSLNLSADRGLELYWYVVATATPAGGAVPSLPAVAPQAIVRATMRAGDSISVNDIAYNAGPLLAQGESQPMHLIPNSALSPGYFATADGGAGYEFRVPMDVVDPNVPRETGFNLRIDLYLSVPGCTDDPERTLMPNVVVLHSSPGHRPRMQFDVADALRIDYLHPQFLTGTDAPNAVVFHVAANSVWGNYDLDDDTVQLTISGPTTPTPANFWRAKYQQRYYEYGHATSSLDIAYVWNYTADNAAPGTYRVDFEVWNDQRTAKATATTYFDPSTESAILCGESFPIDRDARPNPRCEGTLGEPGPKMPGLEVALIAGLVAVAAAVARKRA